MAPPPGRRRSRSRAATIAIAVVAVIGVLVIARLRDDVEPPGAEDAREEADTEGIWSAPADRVEPASGVPTIPVGHLVFDANPTGNHEVHTMAPDGTQVERLTDDPEYDSFWARISPDRSQVLFLRTPAGTVDRNFEVAELWVMGADGSDPRRLRGVGEDGWALQGHPEWSPDGEEIVIAGGPDRTNLQIFVLGTDGEVRRQLTDRPGTSIDPSWSPDGERVAFVGCPEAFCLPGDYEVYVLPADAERDRGERAERVTSDDLRDQDPYYAPGGERLAWLTQVEGGLLPTSQRWTIRQTAPDDRITDLVDRDTITSLPAWSLDGERVYFHRIEPGFSRSFGIYATNADGGEVQRILDDPDVVEQFPSA